MLRLIATALLVTLILSAPATAETACNKRATLIEQLDSRYAEAPVAMGLASNGSLIEILTSGSGTTWTILMTMPDGTACLIAAGQEWETIPILSNDPKV